MIPPAFIQFTSPSPTSSVTKCTYSLPELFHSNNPLNWLSKTIVPQASGKRRVNSLSPQTHCFPTPAAELSRAEHSQSAPASHPKLNSITMIHNRSHSLALAPSLPRSRIPSDISRKRQISPHRPDLPMRKDKKDYCDIDVMGVSSVRWCVFDRDFPRHDPPETPAPPSSHGCPPGGCVRWYFWFLEALS